MKEHSPTAARILRGQVPKDIRLQPYIGELTCCIKLRSCLKIGQHKSPSIIKSMVSHAAAVLTENIEPCIHSGKIFLQGLWSTQSFKPCRSKAKHRISPQRRRHLDVSPYGRMYGHIIQQVVRGTQHLHTEAFQDAHSRE